MHLPDFPGGPVKNPRASTGDKSLIPGPGGLHMPRGTQAHAPQLLKPMHPKACAPQQEKPPQWEAHVQQWEEPLHSNTDQHSQK